MPSSKRIKRSIHGVLVLDKPAGMSSNQALQKAKWLMAAQKAGHTGNLDPFATGVLPLCFGEATKFSQFLLEADKTYSATFCLGVETDTYDLEGKIVAQINAQHITIDAIKNALSNFEGPILQVPPMVSALKVNGKRLHELARQGIEVARAPRPVVIRSLQIHHISLGEKVSVELTISCTKGTYIRSLAHDLGALLQVGGHVTQLNRIMSGPYQLQQAITLKDLESLILSSGHEAADTYLLPMDSAVKSLPELTISHSASHYFGHGQAITCADVYRLGAQGDTVRVFREDGIFLGLGEVTDEAAVKPRRLVVISP